MQLLRLITPTIVLACSAQHIATAKACKTLLDNDSTLVKSLAKGYQEDFSEFPFDAVFSDLHHAVPWLSTCAAAIDPVAGYASMKTSSSFISCVRKIEQFNLDDGLWSSGGWKSLCPLLKDTAVPCVKNAMVEIVMDAFATTNGCCDSFLAQVDSLFSDSLTTIVEKLSQYAVNILCSERKLTNLQATASTEMCGYSIARSFGFIESEDDIVPLLGLLQLPNAAMCDAFAGKAFKITNGSTFAIGFGTNGADTIGICLQPIDALLSYVASWPLFTQTWNANGTSFSPSSLFATGKFLSFATLKSWFNTPNNLPAIMQLTLERFMSSADEFMSDRYSADYYVDYNDTNDGYGPISASYDSDVSVGDSSASYSSDGSAGDSFNYSRSFGWGGYVGDEFNFSQSGSGDSSNDAGYGYGYGYYSDPSPYYGNYYGYGSYYGYSSYYGYGSSRDSSRDGDQDLIIVLLERLMADIGRMLLHVPNGGDCKFSGQTITVPYDVTKVSAVVTVATAVTSAP
ncbi:hypothetical protein PF001_g28745, partial [Phytophthora fragariae]